MDKKRKEYIDLLWKNTELGNYIYAAVKNDKKKLDEINQKVFNSGYYGGIYQLEREISEKIANEVSSEKEFDEYIKILDSENGKLVDVLISHDLLMSVYSYLIKNRHNNTTQSK